MFDLIEGDCLEVMRDIPSGSVDMVLCDLPYGTTQNKWDTIVPLDELWGQYKRVCCGAVVLTATQPFTSTLVTSNIDWYRYELVWEKTSVTGHLNAHRRPMRTHEDILVFSKNAPPYYPQGLVPYNKIEKRGHNGSNFGKSGSENYQEYTNYPRSIVRIANDAKPVHPTQKPVALMEYLIRTYTNEGATVLDSTMGSGTTGVACMSTGRKFIGIEKDAKYFDIACSRIEEAYAVRKRD
jgi:site-specific DNA-methyltransferase (adenine-specific)